MAARATGPECSRSARSIIAVTAKRPLVVKRIEILLKPCGATTTRTPGLLLVDLPVARDNPLWLTLALFRVLLSSIAEVDYFGQPLQREFPRNCFKSRQDPAGSR